MAPRMTEAELKTLTDANSPEQWDEAVAAILAAREGEEPERYKEDAAAIFRAKVH